MCEWQRRGMSDKSRDEDVAEHIVEDEVERLFEDLGQNLDEKAKKKREKEEREEFMRAYREGYREVMRADEKLIDSYIDRKSNRSHQVLNVVGSMHPRVRGKAWGMFLALLERIAQGANTNINPLDWNRFLKEFKKRCGELDTKRVAHRAKKMLRKHEDTLTKASLRMLQEAYKMLK